MNLTTKLFALLFIASHLSISVTAWSQSNSNLDVLRVREEYTKGFVQSAKKDIRDLIAVYKKMNDPKNLAKSFTLLGQILVENGDYESAKDTLKLAFDLSTKEFGYEEEETLEAKKYLSWAYGYTGDTATESKYSIEILTSYLKNEGKYALEIADLYNNISMQFGVKNNRKQEKEFLAKAKKILENYKPKNEAEKLKSQFQLASVLNSISQSCINSLDFKNAIGYARRSLQISEKINAHSPERAPAMVALGRCLSALEKKCDSAIYYIDNALSLLDTNKLMQNQAWLSYRSYKVNILAQCGNAERAKEEGINTIRTILNKGVSPTEALTQLLILNQNSFAELLQIEENRRNSELKDKEASYKLKLFSFGLISILILIIGSTISIANNNRKRKEIQLQKVELESSLIENKFQLIRMDSHFISNCVNSAIEYIDAKEIVNAKNYLLKFYKMLRDKVDESPFNLISLSKELKNLEDCFELESPRIKNGLEWVINIDEDIDTDNIEIPPLILQPFVENALKHGVHGIDRMGKITVAIKKTADRVFITIEDNGRGINLNESKSASRGMLLTQERLDMFTKLNNADAKCEIKALAQGTQVNISFNSFE